MKLNFLRSKFYPIDVVANRGRGISNVMILSFKKVEYKATGIVPTCTVPL